MPAIQEIVQFGSFVFEVSPGDSVKSMGCIGRRQIAMTVITYPWKPVSPTVSARNRRCSISTLARAPFSVHVIAMK